MIDIFKISTYLSTDNIGVQDRDYFSMHISLTLTFHDAHIKGNEDE